MKHRKIIPNVIVKSLHDPSQASEDAAYWRRQTPQARMDVLEEIRTEYISWKYPDEPGFQRVISIIKRK